MPLELGLDCIGERLGRRASVRRAASSSASLHARLGLRERGRRGRERIGAVLERGELGASVLGAGQELRVRLAAGSAACVVGDPLELAPRPARAGRARPRASPGTAAARAPSRSAAARRLGARRPRRASSGAIAPTAASARSARPASPAAPSPSSGASACAASFARLRQLGDVPEPFPLAAKRVLGVRRETFGVLDERAQLVQPRFLARRLPAELLVSPAGCTELAPGGPQLGAEPKLLLARRTRRAHRAGRTAARGGAARTGRTSRSAARPAAARSSRATRCGPTRMRECARRRRRAARARARPRPRAVARRAPPGPPLRAGPSGRSNSASTYASSAPGPTYAGVALARRAADRSPGRGSSFRRPSRP